MAANIGNYTAEGPFDHSSQLPECPGVFVVLGAYSDSKRWIVAYVGVSDNIRTVMDDHPDRDLWYKSGYPMLSVAVIRAEEDRTQIMDELRRQYELLDEESEATG